MEYMLFECAGCGRLHAFRGSKPDGCRCASCGRHLILKDKGDLNALRTKYFVYGDILVQERHKPTATPMPERLAVLHRDLCAACKYKDIAQIFEAGHDFINIDMRYDRKRKAIIIDENALMRAIMIMTPGQSPCRVLIGRYEGGELTIDE